MTLNVLFAAKPERWKIYKPTLTRAFEERGLRVYLATDIAPEDVDYIVYAPNGDLQDFTPYTRTKAVLGLWAGVEDVVGNATLTQPFARMVDDGLTRGMVEWVTGHVLRHHLGTDLHVHGQDGEWRNHVPPLACDRPVTILGLGALGAACGDALASLGFPVTGWSRSPKDLPNLTCKSGPKGLISALKTAEIVVLLLPLTDQTSCVLNTKTLALLPNGAVVINPGRGPLIDDTALLHALNTGQLSHATLDVFRTEPLPKEHGFWSHPNITVTPHIASETRPLSASRVIAQNIERGETGKPLLHLVDRNLGY